MDLSEHAWPDAGSSADRTAGRGACRDGRGQHRGAMAHPWLGPRLTRQRRARRGCPRGLDKDLANGKYSLVDSFQVFRCGDEVYSAKYEHDYATIYSKEAKTKGPLNARLTGRYNYFDPNWHPYYHGTDLHTMQSISKTVDLGNLGIRDFTAEISRRASTRRCSTISMWPRVKNVDDRKRRMTLKERADHDHRAQLDRGRAVRRSAQRLELDGGNRRLGKLRHR